MAWQGYVRAQAHNHSHAVVSCRPTSCALYADFADEFITLEKDSIECNVQKCASPIGANAMAIIKRRMARGDKWISGDQIYPPNGQEFVRYGVKQQALSFDLLIHARDTPKTHYGKSSLVRNWPVEHWTRIRESLPAERIASIGLSGQAAHVPGTQDLRDIDLRSLMNFMASSRLIAGISSGPMHLAALCGLRMVIWAHLGVRHAMGQSMEDRITRLWNPFRVPVTLISGRTPSPDLVQEAIRVALYEQHRPVT